MRGDSGHTAPASVYDTLRADIMDMTLKPGTAMSTQEVATRLGVSRTPVREAFIRLQREGLVEVYPQKETVVSRIDLKRVEQERFLRKSLELAMAEPLIQHVKKEDIEHLEELTKHQEESLRRGDYTGFLQLDDEFHRTMFVAAGQLLGWETAANANGHYNRIRLLSVENADIADHTLSQHRNILKFIRERDAEKLREELKGHLERLLTEQEDMLRRFPQYFEHSDDSYPMNKEERKKTNMKMIMRWFPYGDDSVTLSQIKQTPGVSGVATCMPNVPVGEVWPLDAVMALKQEIANAGLEMEVIESVNIHEDIKKGLSTRDVYIDHYIKTMEHLSKAGVKCICYNFMPVIDWARNDLAFPLPDGSTVMAYRHEEVKKLNPATMADAMQGKARGFSLPGWEPERLGAMGADIEFYQSMTQDEYWGNMKYFLDAIIPYAEKYDIKMAIHPDDPPWPLYGLPKVITCAENIRKFLALNTSPYNGLTLCTGSLGSSVHNDIPALIREFAGEGRVHFAHVRNVKHLSEQDFDEAAHLSECGDLDMYAIMKALYESGFDGYIRPDHGRMIWGEQARPGYGLYDRAIGSNYLLGLWEAIDKAAQGK